MNTSIPPVAASVPLTQTYALPAGKPTNADTVVPTTTQVQHAAPAVADTVAVSAPATVQDSAAREAILSFKNVYAVSDKQFTIFKDATGKFITRYVSLRDGSVTYEPSAPTLTAPVTSGPQVAISA